MFVKIVLRKTELYANNVDAKNTEIVAVRSGNMLGSSGWVISRFKYEELLIDESEQETKYSSIFIAKPTQYKIEQLNEDIVALFLAEDKIKALQKIVPEFSRTNHNMT